MLAPNLIKKKILHSFFKVMFSALAYFTLIVSAFLISVAAD